jgi:serine/threonine protein kinase
MTLVSLPIFIEELEQYALLGPEQLAELAQLQARLPDAHALARELIKRDWLTPYQANQLLQGHGKSLVLGAYRLLERLGEGGMGQVFKARHLKMSRTVALKLVRKEFLSSPQSLARFNREVRAAAHLAHPNVVVAFDAAEVGGCHYLAMEFVEGIDLARHVKRHGPLPVGVACGYVRQAAQGLQHAHERKVVHRDIKPGNLLVTRPDPDGPTVVKILDFGLARFESERTTTGRVTQVGSFVGTVDYIAPEQAEDARTADIRADIYALGGTLFYLLTGRPPFEGKDLVSKMTAKLMRPPPSARAVRPEVPAALDAVLQKMLARRPAERYQTPREVVAALMPFATEEAVPLAGARPAGTGPASQASAGTQPESASGSQGGDTTLPPAIPSAATARTVTLATTPPLPAAAARVWPEAHRLRLPPKQLMLIGSGAAAGLLLLGILAVTLWSGSGETNTAQTTEPELKAQTTEPELKLQPFEPITLSVGESQVISVAVQRQACDGPIEVHAEQLPAGITVAPLTIPVGEKSGRLQLLTGPPGKAAATEIRIVAQSGRLRAEAPVKLVLREPPRSLLAYQLGPRMQIDFKAADAHGGLQKITYGAATSNTVVQVDGTAAEFGGVRGSWDPLLSPIEPGPASQLRRRRSSTWLYDLVRVTQTIEVVPNRDGHYDTALVSYRLVNTDGQPHRLGLRCMVDTMMGTNDGHPFILPGNTPQLIQTSADFRPAAVVPAFVTATEQPNLTDPGLTAHFTLKLGGGLEAPDRFSITTWPRGSIAWDLPVLNIGDDAAVVIYWNAKVVPANGERRLGYAYGLGVVSEESPGRWTSRPAPALAGPKP